MMQLQVEYIDQSGCAPTGCESVTAVMLLRYLGVDMDVDTFLDTYLDRRDFEIRDGVLYGAHPAEYFVGDPRDPEAMGCYAPVLRKAIARCLPEGYFAVDETGTGIDELVERYLLHEGTPVALWTTIDLKPHVEGPSWRLFDSGREFVWRSNEHCLLLIGEDGDDYICADPWENHGIVRYDKALMRRRHLAQYMQAVGVRRRG